MALGFSLRLLERRPSSGWLLFREEPRVPCPLFLNSLKLRLAMYCGEKVKTLDVVMRPLGVINGVLLGYAIGNYQDVFSKDWFPLNGPHCRRFAMDLKTGEFLEVHWYNNGTCMVSWMQMSQSQQQIRYFVLYETPPPGRLPYKLKGSVELMLQIDSSRQGKFVTGKKHHLNDDETVVTAEVDAPFAFPGMKEALRRVVGVFQGTGRTTSYDPMNLSVTDDFTFPYKQVTYILQDESYDRENQDGYAFSSIGVVEPPLFSIWLPVVTTSLDVDVMNEILRQESFHLQASDQNIQDDVFRKVIAREKRWSRRLWRNFKRRVREKKSIIEEAMIPLIAHSAAMHLGFSLSEDILKQRHVQFDNNADEEVKTVISTMLKLSSGLWMVSSSGENIFLVNRTLERNDNNFRRGQYESDFRSDNVPLKTAVLESTVLASNADKGSHETNSMEEQSTVETLVERVRKLERENTLLMQRIKQLEKERYRSTLWPNVEEGLEQNHTAVEGDYHDELNRILREMDGGVYNEWEVVSGENGQNDFML
eukprot:jgi/Galph1/2265/GphlegSOOS_G923.1